ncbi:hypothetical protein OCGS_1386 [Oceaniovalibus guishaninsula JLT2003]|uniref:Uncharacterized protein n=1 Tax=Oceaniovalibus guishaninsula JLT2003 TaxID=1231392 RepID=K2HAJ2_9RHOB|nr:hypothetical protein [Oceaniovalibus guishaninsula]EKE44548.1 hypothetical protein OCGS_1386 [Oceaniovalibus guishaninsula JLT2003]
MTGEQIGYLSARLVLPVLAGLLVALLASRRMPRRQGRMAGVAVAALLFIGGFVGASGGQPQPSEDSLRANHEGFVRASVETCLAACEDTGDGTCVETCGCVGEQLGARIAPRDLYDMFVREQRMSREEAMAPYIDTIRMGYAACGAGDG